MAGRAVFGGLVLTVAIQACSHVVLDGEYSHRSFRYVAMASGAINFGLVMRRMAKPDQRLRAEAINPLPRNLDASRGILSDLLHVRFVDRQFLMAQHTLSNRGNAGGGLPVGSRVTVQAGQAQ